MASRNGSVAEAQLTFKGVEFAESVEASTFKLPPMSSSFEQLDGKDRAKVVLVSAAGEVLVESEVRVAGIAFVRHPETAKQSAWVERVHKLEPVA